MKLVIRDVGVVTRTEIKPKPLTIICGKNNTGKTYAMYTLWGIVNLPSTIMVHKLADYDNFIDKIIDKGEFKGSLYDFFNLYFDDIRNAINASAPKKLSSIFKASASFFKNSQVYIDIEKKDFLKNFLSTINSQIQLETNFMTLTYKPKTGLFTIKSKIDSYQNGFPKILYIKEFSELMLSIFLWDFGSQAFLMPTERSGLNLFFNEIETRDQRLERYLSGLSDQNFNFDRTQVADADYSMPIESYVDFLRKNKATDGVKNKYTDMIQGIFTDVIGGGFRKEKNKIFFKTTAGIELDLNLASSSVKTNFALWAYLNTEPKPNGLLMIDEPELNLHPDAQRTMARILVRLVNAGLKVAVSTHSDYFIREMNTMIMLSNDFPEKLDLMKHYGYTDQDILQINQVGAYHFCEGGVSYEMGMGLEFGIEVKSFDIVANATNQSYGDIYDAVENYNNPI